MKHLVSYQREVDMDKLTAVASFEKLTFRAWALRWSKDEWLTLETSAFQNSLCRLIYPYQLHVDNLELLTKAPLVFPSDLPISACAVSQGTRVLVFYLYCQQQAYMYSSYHKITVEQRFTAFLIWESLIVSMHMYMYVHAEVL